MLTDEEVYRRLDAMLPPGVERWGAQANFEAGEPECAITALMDAAFVAGGLPVEALRLIRSNYDGGPVIEILEALVALEDR
ncbi:hypothetical protein G7Y31_06700 [Corynebacterium lizhenjunii]|uniref:Uncharacterized protein n=1 Tax=Corynebacterium lizhenjunii TaxID=2709394 RepID=A0A7T0KE52_9CORY|nr:hypothetical protein [Corynebacterium lizhenjunii]QPK78274.1 hypothetical protein G7Y31_06700 [Corynebacterium lizhenjunii]